jgi:hypothetical protein
MHPESGAIAAARTFKPGEIDLAEAWVDDRSGEFNLYYTANEVRPDFEAQKPRKEDIAALRAIFADTDPVPGDLTAERARLLRRLESEPVLQDAFIIDSGGGYQAVLPLDQKLPMSGENRAWAEAAGRGLANSLSSDAVQNVDRLLRLPGPLNIPTPAKKAKGRVARTATVVRPAQRRLAKEQIEKSIELDWYSSQTDNSPRIAAVIEELGRSGYDEVYSFGELEQDLQATFKASLEAHPKLQALWSGHLEKADQSGSQFRAALAGFLGRIGGYTAEEYARLAWVWPHAVQAADEDIRDQKLNPRALAREWVKFAEPAMARHDVESFFTETEEGDAAVGAVQAERPKGRLIPTITFEEGAASALTAGNKPLVKGLLDEGAMTVLYGPSNVGKTFVTMDLAFHISRGTAWGSMKTTKTGVLYIAAEGGPGVRKRLAALKRRYPDAPGGDFHLILSSLDLLKPEADLRPLVDTIRAIEARIGFVVVDTLSRAMAGGEENSTSDMGAMVKHLDIIRNAARAHVFVVHHSGKEIAKGARGSSVLRAATDTEIEISDGCIRVTKQRDLDKNLSFAFRLDPVELGVDSDGDPITSATMTFVDPEETLAGVPTAAEARVLAALQIEWGMAEAAAKGVRPGDLAELTGTTGPAMTPESIRTHLRNLATKHLVRAPARGLWVPREPKTQSSEWFSERADSSYVTRTYETIGRESGRGVFA